MASSRIEIDGETKVIKICGVQYTFEVFKEFGFAPAGTKIEIVSREDGLLTVKRLP